MNKAAEIKKILEENPQYQETLFIKGYLVTNRTFDNLNEYPFYNNWGKGKCGKFKDGKDVNVYYHKKQDH